MSTENERIATLENQYKDLQKDHAEALALIKVLTENQTAINQKLIKAEYYGKGVLGAGAFLVFGVGLYLVKMFDWIKDHVTFN